MGPVERVVYNQQQQAQAVLAASAQVKPLLRSPVTRGLLVAAWRDTLGG